MPNPFAAIASAFKSFGLRDIGHFLAAFVGALLSAVIATGAAPTTSVQWAALAAGAASVAFRKLFPNVHLSVDDFIKMYRLLQEAEKAVNPVIVTAPSATPVPLFAAAQALLPPPPVAPPVAVLPPAATAGEPTTIDTPLGPVNT